MSRKAGCLCLNPSYLPAESWQLAQVPENQAAVSMALVKVPVCSGGCGSHEVIQ